MFATTVSAPASRVTDVDPDKRTRELATGATQRLQEAILVVLTEWWRRSAMHCLSRHVNEQIYRPVTIRSDAELTLLKMAFMRAS